MNIEELSEDFAEDLTEFQDVIGNSGVLSVLNKSQHLQALRVAGIVFCGLASGDLTIEREDIETLQDNGGGSVETTREGVDGTTNSNNQIIKVALTI